MADESSQSIAPQPSDVQFSIRGLMMITLGVALAAAALGPYFRALQPEQRTPVSILWGVCGALALGWVAYHGRTRYRLEQEAGRKILGLSPRGRWIRDRPPWLTVAGGCLWVAFGLFYLVTTADSLDTPPGATPSVFGIVSRSLFSAIFIALGISTIWWNRETQFREQGILYGLLLLRWTHVTSHEWKVGGVSFEGVDQAHNDIQIAVNVSPTQRASVETVLAEKLQGRVHKTAGEASGGVPVVVALPPIQITPRQKVSGRRVMIGIGFYVGVVLALAVRPWGAPPKEFNIGAGVAFALVFLGSIIQRRPVQRAGAPLIRLRVRTDWPRVVGAMLVAASGYYVNQHLPFTHPLLAGGLGFVSGLGVAALFRVILCDQLDLCENGLVLVRWEFWPWTTIRIAKWNNDSNGRLILNHGWRRVIAKVRIDQLAAVDAVLAEKRASASRP